MTVTVTNNTEKTVKKIKAFGRTSCPKLEFLSRVLFPEGLSSGWERPSQVLRATGWSLLSWTAGPPREEGPSVSSHTTAPPAEGRLWSGDSFVPGDLPSSTSSLPGGARARSRAARTGVSSADQWRAGKHSPRTLGFLVGSVGRVLPEPPASSAGLLVCLPGFCGALRIGHTWKCFVNGKAPRLLVLSNPRKVMAEPCRIPQGRCRPLAISMLPQLKGGQCAGDGLIWAT